MTECNHIVFDAYPHVEGPHFGAFAGAEIGCWIPVGVPEPEALARRQLLDEGWEACAVIDQSVVSPETYRNQSSGRDEYEQAINSGFAAHIHQRKRETVSGESDAATRLSVKNYSLLVARLDRGAWSLYSGDDQQWANGVTPDGDDFVPLWTERATVFPWTHYWPGYEVTQLAKNELVGEHGLLAGIATELMWAAVELGEVLITVHPTLLRRDLEAHDRK